MHTLCHPLSPCQQINTECLIVGSCFITNFSKGQFYKKSSSFINPEITQEIHDLLMKSVHYCVHATWLAPVSVSQTNMFKDSIKLQKIELYKTCVDTKEPIIT